jgi:phage gpG-like protein
MITYKFDQSQLNALKKATDSASYKKAVDVALFNIGEEVSKTAKENAPHKLGDLRRSIESKVTPGKYVEVGTNKKYAMIHEFGGTIHGNPYLKFQINGQWVTVASVTIPARPYMTPPYERMVGGQAIDFLLKEFDKILK